jgi:formylglycine-generating enzyme required for sulfatase activity
MRSYLMIAVLALLPFLAFAKKDNCISVKSVDIIFQQVFGGYYISQEITNGQYLAFLIDLANQGRALEAVRFLPDSTQWVAELAYNEPMVEHYFRHPAYSGYPVVNITKEGADAYCAWLTEMVKKDEKLNLPNATCSLPTEAKWITASAPFMENPYPWYGPYAYNEKGQMLCNIKVNRVDKNAFLQYQGIGSVAFTTTPESFYPNKYGLYNVIGNVAEITSEGYVKGGSWGNTFDECAVTKRQDYTLPNAHVGFRVMLKKEPVAVSYFKGGN